MPETAPMPPPAAGVHPDPAAAPPLRYLSGADVIAAMPGLREQLDLAERTMVALATPGGSQLPPKIGVHPRPEGSFAHAMPAHLRAPDPADDLLGIKWVTGFAANAELGLPAISATIVLNDPGTGLPIAILDGGPVTAVRTAAVSGVAIARFAPAIRGRPPRAAILGAGVQGSSHLPILGALLPGVELAIFDRHPERAERLAETARRTDGVAAAAVAPTARAAADGADVVVTVAAFTTPDRRQTLTNDWLADDALVVAVDYATYVAAEVASAAAAFFVDDEGQFLANRESGQFDGYPAPGATLGAAILAGTPRPAGRVLVSHLGVGLADAVFGAAILRNAERLGLGARLAR